MPLDFLSLSKPADKPKPMVFDPNGDLTLLIGPLKIPCKVCSKALARGSPVFKAMLYGPFAESKANFAEGDWVVHLPEDQINAMKYILNIIHGHVDKIPKKLPETIDIFKQPSWVERSAVCLYLVSRTAQIVYDENEPLQILFPSLDLSHLPL